MSLFSPCHTSMDYLLFAIAVLCMFKCIEKFIQYNTEVYFWKNKYSLLVQDMHNKTYKQGYTIGRNSPDDVIFQETMTTGLWSGGFRGTVSGMLDGKRYNLLIKIISKFDDIPPNTLCQVIIDVQRARPDLFKQLKKLIHIPRYARAFARYAAKTNDVAIFSKLVNEAKISELFANNVAEHAIEMGHVEIVECVARAYGKLLIQVDAFELLVKHGIPMNMIQWLQEWYHV